MKILLAALSLLSAATTAPDHPPMNTQTQERLAKGRAQVSALWTAQDGDLDAFVKDHFVEDATALPVLLARFETNLEQVDGHFLELGRELRRAVEVDQGPMLRVDPLFAAWDPSAHVVEDMFASKLAFVALLNFSLSTLEERTVQGPKWTREQWAASRLTSRFGRRVPGTVQQEMSTAQAAADLYIADYNLWMHHILSDKGKRIFPSGKRLISHWNLRDELKAAYADPKGLERQRVIVKLMERIVTQAIPAAVINNPRVDYNPFTNAVSACPKAELEAAPPPGDAALTGAAEPNTRYQKLLANFHAQRKADSFSPVAPTAVDRAFSLDAEMPEARVKALFLEVLQSPLVPQVAKEIEKQLKRKLEPVDLWYNGFLPRGKIPETQLDALTAAKYPTAAAFAGDIPRILTALGFTPQRAKYLSDNIRVDPSRGAGHAQQSARRGDYPRLRTRVEKDGMNYKGYNIAVHELGHNVEQVFSLYDVDHTLLQGTPNTAFTEAVAFVFQARDLELLGQGKPDAAQERLRVLNDFWATWEIAGVAMVDIETWHWMYEHPTATPAQLKDAVVTLSTAIWDKHYAPVLGGGSTPLLGIYSHMISNPLYLFNYPLGHFIAFQIEEQVTKAGTVGPEIERMTRVGRVGPDEWMMNATGQPVSATPLLRATAAALATK